MLAKPKVSHVAETTRLTGDAASSDTVKHFAKCMFYIKDREGEKEER